VRQVQGYRECEARSAAHLHPVRRGVHGTRGAAPAEVWVINSSEGFIGHATDSLWSVDLFRCESIVLRSYWVLVVMDQFTRRLVGVGVHCGPVSWRRPVHGESLISSAFWNSPCTGTNTRRIKGALAPLLRGGPLSKDAVSRLVGRLADDFDTWRQRDLAADGIQYLMLDG
jgi:Transposase, Mutator family